MDRAARRKTALGRCARGSDRSHSCLFEVIRRPSGWHRGVAFRKERPMSKAVVTKLFVGGFVAVIAGLVFGFMAVWAAYASGVFVMNGPDWAGIDATPFAWAMVGVVLLGFMAILAGVAAGFVAWIGA